MNLKLTVKKPEPNYFILALTLLLVSAQVNFAQTQVDHQRLAQEVGCFKCHHMPPQLASATQVSSSAQPEVDPRLKAGAGAWCVSCHAMEARTLHPTGIAADPGAGLPLEEGSMMSCLTCHSPHRAAIATEPWAPLIIEQDAPGGFKTFLLNHPNNNGQLCSKCHADGGTAERATMHRPRSYANRDYAGSKSCQTCHADIFDQWRLTPHARMTRKLIQVENQAEIPVEELGFPRDKIAWVLGSHYIHRFVAEASGTLVVLPKIWDRHEKKWLPVHDYGWKNRYWLKQCAGCHTTGFSSEDDSFVEAGVGCESCHGPALNHTRTGSKEFIRSIKSMPADRQEMICESCHTSGLDNSGEYHFPVGYRPGEDLTEFFSGLTPKPGQSPENFFGDETYADRRRQWDFLKSRFLLASGLTCDYCQNFRNIKTRDNSQFLSTDEYCLTCHTDMADHPEESPGTNCLVCHQPAKTASGTISIHDHRFIFK
jgi:hypothetical protein